MRTKTLIIRLTEEEKKYLEKEAEKNNTKISMYVRKKIFN